VCPYKIVDLSQSFGRNTPLWPWPGQMVDIAIERVAFYERDQKLTTKITTKMHAATHTDAPAHVLPGGKYIDEMPLESFYGTGVVVDIPKEKWEVITAEDLEAAKPEIQGGDFVIVHTGWHRYWKKDNYAYMNYSPGFYREAGEWFVERGVKAVGIDCVGLDHALAHPPLDKYMPWVVEEYRSVTGRHPDEDFPLYEPCHKLILGNGIAGYENVGGDIAKVVGKRVTLAGFPLKYEQGDGSLVRLVAIVEP
jgi:kynurenine formamidase